MSVGRSVCPTVFFSLRFWAIQRQKSSDMSVSWILMPLPKSSLPLPISLLPLPNRPRQELPCIRPCFRGEAEGVKNASERHQQMLAKPRNPDESPRKSMGIREHLFCHSIPLYFQCPYSFSHRHHRPPPLLSPSLPISGNLRSAFSHGDMNVEKMKYDIEWMKREIHKGRIEAGAGNDGKGAKIGLSAPIWANSWICEWMEGREGSFDKIWWEF